MGQCTKEKSKAGGYVQTCLFSACSSPQNIPAGTSSKEKWDSKAQGRITLWNLVSKFSRLPELAQYIITVNVDAHSQKEQEDTWQGREREGKSKHSLMSAFSSQATFFFRNEEKHT